MVYHTQRSYSIQILLKFRRLSLWEKWLAMFDLEGKEYVVSRDVVFYEEEYPYEVKAFKNIGEP